jgi:hypothetical protein
MRKLSICRGGNSHFGEREQECRGPVVGVFEEGKRDHPA